MDNKHLFSITLLLLGSLFSQLSISASSSQTDDIWVVVESAGQNQAIAAADLEADSNWQNLSPGANVTAPAYLRTGTESRLVLKHRNDNITISADSLIKLEAEKYTSEGIFTRIIQTLGYALFDIEHNTGRTNIVETPYLISVVKGTTFTVQVDRAHAIVDLIKGRLQIKAATFDASTFINSGQSAQLGRNDKAITVLDTNTHINPAALLQQDNRSEPHGRANPPGTNKATGIANATASSIKGNAASSGIAGSAEAIGPMLPKKLAGTSLAPLAPLAPLTPGNPNKAGGNTTLPTLPQTPATPPTQQP